jgi:hypothetical protein
MYVSKVVLVLVLFVVVAQAVALRSRARQVRALFLMYLEMSDWVKALCVIMKKFAQDEPGQPWLQLEFAQQNDENWQQLIRSNHFTLRQMGLPPATAEDNMDVVGLKSRHGIPFEEEW